MTAEQSPDARRAPRSARALVALLTFALLATLSAVLPQSASAAAYHARSHSRTRYESYVANAVLGRMNAERRAHHLAPLKMNSDLLASARRHNVTMAYWNEMSHRLPREAYFATRISQEGYRWTWAGENVAWNSQMNAAGVLNLQTYMYNEKAPDNGHRLNILNSHYVNIGIDVYVDRQHHKMWLTQDFGRR